MGHEAFGRGDPRPRRFSAVRAIFAAPFGPIFPLAVPAFGRGRGGIFWRGLDHDFRRGPLDRLRRALARLVPVAERICHYALTLPSRDSETIRMPSRRPGAQGYLPRADAPPHGPRIQAAPPPLLPLRTGNSKRDSWLALPGHASRSRRQRFARCGAT